MTKRKKRERARGDDLEVALLRPYWRMLFGFLCCAGAGAFMIREAVVNVRGLIINGIIHLGPGQADVFYAVMGAFCVAGAALSLGNLGALLPGRPFRLRIADDEIRLPRWPLWKHEEAVVLLDEVLAVAIQPAGNRPGLVIVSKVGRFPLPAMYLPPEWSLTQVADRIIAGIPRPPAPKAKPAPDAAPAPDAPAAADAAPEPSNPDAA
jgi:hypothetical protein